MKVLWITNMLLPPVCKKLQIPCDTGGGWLYSSLSSLLQIKSDIDYGVAAIYNGSEFSETLIDNVRYFLIPSAGFNQKYHREYETYLHRISESYNPDVVHIHGTEFPLGLAWLKKCGNKGVIVSIQGLVSVIARYYMAGVESYPLTFRDIVRLDTPRMQQRKFAKRGKYEIEIIKLAPHIAGRTEWDRAHALTINPKAQYHHCGESLRSSFYQHKWEYDKCQPHSIFVSQASYPIKGLHILIEAIAIVLNRYPDTKLFVAGHNIVDRHLWKISGYGQYLKRLINRLSLNRHIIFTGVLDEKGMLERYLSSHLFVCPSAIENSPNSLAEALVLGMPTLASFAGGIPDMVNGNLNILYRFEETEMLAQKICAIFALGDKIESEAVDINRYSPIENALSLTDTYHIIHSSEK